MVCIKRQLLKQMKVLTTQGPFDQIIFSVSGSFREIFDEGNLFCLAMSASYRFPSSCTLLVFFWTDAEPSLKSWLSIRSTRVGSAAPNFLFHQRIIFTQSEMLSVVITGCIEYINLSLSLSIKGLLNSLSKMSVCHSNTWRNSWGEICSEKPISRLLVLNRDDW